MKTKKDLLNMGKFKVGDGSQTRFWRMLGWITTLSKINTHSCITLYRRRGGQWQWFLD
jgi:hypothetical protein